MRSTPRQVLLCFVILAFGMSACSSDTDQPQLGPSDATTLPADPVAEAEAAALAFDGVLRSLADGYRYELTLDDGSLRREGVNLGSSSTRVDFTGATTTETIVVGPTAVTRLDAGPWVETTPPSDHDPLAPLLGITEVAVTGSTVTANYPAPLLGREGDWALVEIDTTDGVITLTSADPAGVATLRFEPITPGLTIALPS